MKWAVVGSGAVDEASVINTHLHVVPRILAKVIRYTRLHACAAAYLKVAILYVYVCQYLV